MRRVTSVRLAATGIVVMTAAAGAAILVTRLTGDAGAARPASAKPVATAVVQRTDLAETTPVAGTVGFAGPYTIVQPAGTAAPALTEAQQALAQAQQARSQAEAALAADVTRPQVDDAVLVADRNRVDAARLALSNAQAGLASAASAAVAYDPTSKYTALPALGQVVEPGQSLWSVDGRAVPLLPGTLSPWRVFASGMSPGADVAALNDALIHLGFGAGLKPSDSFTNATAAAVRRLQSSFGLAPTGFLRLGSVAFAPAAVRVTAVHTLPGKTVTGGEPVLDVTSTTAVVNVALPVGQSARVRAGDAVSVNLPDGTVGDGTITSVGTVATDTTPSNSGNTTTTATVKVVVSLTNASPAASLDQAPVTVNITNNSVHQVLAVPTTALLALAGGGYAIEVVEPGGDHRLVAVTTGAFDDQSGMVEVRGPDVAEGQHIVVAS